MNALLLGDRELGAIFSDADNIRTMLVFEAALARAEARHGVIPHEAANRICEACKTLTINPSALAPAVARDGVPVPELVYRLREAVGDGDAGFVHFGATSQDVVDTSLVLRLRSALDIIDDRLQSLGAGLARLADAHRATAMVGRTRGMQAAPMTFGLKVAGWLAPLIRHRDRLKAMRPRLEQLSFAGAVGTLSTLGDTADDVAQTLAQELSLALPTIAWHSQRDGLVELGGWAANVTGSLGKIGQDTLLMAASEVGELRIASAGASSTMPNKVNPIGPETLVSLARFNAQTVGGVYLAEIQEHERGGAGWTLEWLTLPQVMIACGAALRIAQNLIDDLEVDDVRMKANLEGNYGLAFAEGVAFALARSMPLPEAQALVKGACRTAVADGRKLSEVMAGLGIETARWRDGLDMAPVVERCATIIDRVIGTL